MKTKEKKLLAVKVLLKLNAVTRQEYLAGRNGAKLVYSSTGNPVVVKDVSGGVLIAHRSGRDYTYSLDDGRCTQRIEGKAAKNYKYIRVQVTFRNIEEAQASPLFKYCVSRLKTNLPKGGIVAGFPADEHIYKKCEHLNNETAKAGVYEEYAKWVREFTNAYQDIEPRLEFCATISAVAIFLSIAAAVASIIALIVVAV